MTAPVEAFAAAVIGVLIASVATAQADETPSRAVAEPVRGVLRPLTQAAVSVDLPARVARIGVLEGERFAAGATLLELDCRRQRAELAGAAALLREARIEAESQQFLARHQSGARVDLETALAKVERAKAGVAEIEARLDHCVVVAPFDGRVAELAIRLHEMPSPGRPLVVLIEEGELEVEMIVPSHWLAWLEPGKRFSFTIDETHWAHEGRVHRIAAVVDTVSQMVKVTGRLSNRDGRIVTGMSGSAIFLAEGH
ncbi:MAG: efflux RND transporter periplasmic adaptor subunit [Pseudomonadota bacterium]